MGQINQWKRARGTREMDITDISEVGIIERDIAAGFLHQTDCSTAYLADFVSNPHASVLKRGRAIAFIISELTEIAKELGYQRVIGFSERKSLQKIMGQQGFTKLGAYGAIKEF